MLYRWIAYLCLLIALSIAFRGDLRPLRDVGARVLARQELNDFGQQLGRMGKITGDVRFTLNGLLLAPGESVAVELPFPDGPSRDSFHGVAVWLHRARGMGNAVDCSADGQSFTEVARDVFAPGAIVALTPCRGGPTQVVRIRVSRSAVGPAQPLMALDRFELLALAHPAQSVPGLTPLVTSAVLLAIVMFGPAGLLGVPLTLFLGLCAAGTLVALHIWIPESFELRPSLHYCSDVSIVAALLLIALFAAAGTSLARPPVRLETLAFVLLLGVGFTARWDELAARLGVALSPDASYVQSLAAAMAHPYDTDVREPLWVWGVRLAMLPFGVTSLAPRIFALCCAMLLLAATFWFARRYFTPLHALGVLTLLAVHPALIESAAAAHRTELYALLLVGVAFFAFVPDLSNRLRTVGLAATVPLTVLCQTAGLIPAAGGALASSRVWRSVSLVGALAIGAVLVAVILPHGVYTARRYGQAFYFSRTLVPTFYRNYEFMNVKRTGCDGCPTRAEMGVSSYSGRPATMGEYLFKLHDVDEVVSRLAIGYVRTFAVPGQILNYLLGSGSVIQYLLYLTGTLTLLATRARELLVIPLLSVNLLAFVIPLGIDLRLLLHLAPFMAIAIVCGMATIVTFVARRARVLAPHWQTG